MKDKVIHTMGCGCEVVGDGSDGHPYDVRDCKIHKPGTLHDALTDLPHDALLRFAMSADKQAIRYELKWALAAHRLRVKAEEEKND